MRKIIDRVMGLYPDLSSAGFKDRGFNSGEAFEGYRREMLTQTFEDQVFECCVAFSTQMPRGLGWRIREFSSYTLKHRVEKFIDRQARDHVYIPNGAAITALVILQWLPVRSNYWGSPNCRFKRRATLCK